MYRYELHMHTAEGSACAQTAVHDMIRRYVELGFAGAVVTNHFITGNTAIDRNLPWEDFIKAYSRAYYEGLEAARELDFDLLFGVEESYGGGKEILAYGFEPDFLLERPYLRHAPVSVWSEEVRKVGGFLAYPHPFRQRWYIPEPRLMPDLSLVDGVEIYNRGNAPEDNDYAAKIFAPMDITCIAGSDTHNTDFDDPCGIELRERVRTSAQLAKKLHARDFALRICRK